MSHKESITHREYIPILCNATLILALMACNLPMLSRSKSSQSKEPTPRPIPSLTTVECVAAVDVNNNGQYDQGTDLPIPGLKARYGRNTFTSGNDGVMIITPFERFDVNKLEVVYQTILEDPQIGPRNHRLDIFVYRYEVRRAKNGCIVTPVDFTDNAKPEMANPKRS